MVTVFFRGGLGNQMFQYAAGLSLARKDTSKSKTELAFDTTHVSDRLPRGGFTFRTFDLPEVFDIKPAYTPLSRASRTIPIPGVWLGLDLLFMNLAQSAGKAKILYENEIKGFDQSIFEKTAAARSNSKSPDFILYGRFENEKYFDDENIKSELRERFCFRHPLEGDALQIAQEIEKTNSVALHVRRGDFAKSKAVARVTGAIDSSYYGRAMEYIVGKIPNPHFFIFSDDIAWCKENVRMKFPATYLEPGSAGPKATFHLELMSRCKHNIIANSTFAWWGAWLNNHAGKIVIAPEKWYSDGRPASNIISESWIKI